MRERPAICGLAPLLALGVAAFGASGQTAPPASVTVSTDTIQMGEVFDLEVVLEIPPNRIVYFPDTLPATVNLESAAPVVVRSEPSGVGARLTLAYPVMAFGAGTLPVPGFDVLMAPRGTETGVETLPGGSVVGTWSEAPATAGATAVTRVPRQAVWVVPVFTPADFMAGIEPMPPNDVAGGNWSWPSIALVLVSSSLLLVTLVSTTRDWLAVAGPRGSHGEVLSPDARREQALRRLDDLWAEGLPQEGRILDFYTRSSDIVRGYVEAMDGAWTPSLTSSELMSRFQDRSGDDVTGVLPAEMGMAEVVKFGRLRPGVDAPERHWRALRAWVESSGDTAW